MVRWRYCLVLAMLLLLPLKTASEEEEEEEPEDDADDNDNDETDEEEPSGEKAEPRTGIGRRAPTLGVTAVQTAATRTVPKRPLECYVCAYKAETQIKSCLDPTKHRVHTMTCHNLDEKCFTSVISKGKNYEAIMRGCRSACVGSPEITCCELNRCNNQAFAMPSAIVPRVLTANKSTKAIPHTVLFFVTVLLVLQTVVKVAVV